MAQAKAMIWPWLSSVCRIRSTVAMFSRAIVGLDFLVRLDERWLADSKKVVESAKGVQTHFWYKQNFQFSDSANLHSGLRGFLCLQNLRVTWPNLHRIRLSSRFHGGKLTFDETVVVHWVARWARPCQNGSKPYRFRAKREHLQTFQGFLPWSQG